MVGFRGAYYIYYTQPGQDVEVGSTRICYNTTQNLVRMYMYEVGLKESTASMSYPGTIQDVEAAFTGTQYNCCLSESRQDVCCILWT